MGIALMIARRLSLRGDSRKSTPAVKVSVAAVALSIAVMLASIAIVEGFKREIRNKIVGFNSHITLYALPAANADGDDGDGQNLVSLSPSLTKILDEQQFVTDYRLETSVPGIFKTPKDFKGIYVKGISEVPRDGLLAQSTVEGKVPDFQGGDTQSIMVSRKAASQLGLKAGDSIETYFIADAVRARKMRVAAIFDTHFDAYDDVFAYAPLTTVDSVAGLKPAEGTAIQISVDDFDRVPEYARALGERLENAYVSGEIYRRYGLQTVMEQGANYFQWLALLDTNVAVVLTLMTIVACVTLISGLLILILDKFHFIGLMKSLGASNALLRRIFISMALRIALSGILIGNLLMLALLEIQRRFHLLRLDPDSYYIDFVPVEMSWISFLILNVAVFAIILLTMILPSHFVATIKPAVAMRVE